MDASYKGETGPDYDELTDAVAAACASNDASMVCARYASEDLTVPRSMIA